MRQQLDLLLRNVQLPGGRIADISIDRGFIVHAGADKRAAVSVDCHGMLCLPGAIDMHVHMRDGTQSHKEDWESGSRSAVAGGVTTVVDQPNCIPPVVHVESLAQRIALARKKSICNYAINGGVIREAPLEEMWRAGAMALGETFVAESSFAGPISDDVLGDALNRSAAIGAPITIHAEGVQPGPDDSLLSHDRLRSEKEEAQKVQTITSMAPPGSRIHFCHLSNIHSVNAAHGTVEVTPHHLFLSLDQFHPADGEGKVNPPLRNEKSRRLLWSRWGRIDVIASDHAPHTVEEKTLDFEEVPSGIPGVETTIPMLLAEVYKSRITLTSMLEKTVFNPASILGIKNAGLTAGSRADLALFPRTPAFVNVEFLHSRAGWSPFEGKEAVFPEIVIVNGAVAFRKGEFFECSPRWVPGNGYKPPENK